MFPLSRFVGQFLCSYITPPLYALVTQVWFFHENIQKDVGDSDIYRHLYDNVAMIWDIVTWTVYYCTQMGTNYKLGNINSTKYKRYNPWMGKGCKEKKKVVRHIWRWFNGSHGYKHGHICWGIRAPWAGTNMCVYVSFSYHEAFDHFVTCKFLKSIVSHSSI